MVPDGWNHALLQDVCGEKIVYGIVQAGEHVDAGIPYIKSSDVGGAINAGALAKTALDIHRRYKRSTVEPGDIIFSLRGNTGATSIVPPDLPEANLTQGTARIAVNGKAFGPFLRYQLGSHSVRANIYAVSKGSTFTEISLADLRKIRVLLPPLPEQKKIAEILSTWDRAIETVEALLATARTQKRALMQELLTGKRRFPEFEGQEWREVRLGEAEANGWLKLNRGKVISKKDIAANPGDYPIYSSSVVDNGEFGRYASYMFDEELITWSVDGGGHFFHRKKHRFSVTNVCGWMRVDSAILNYGFLAAQLQFLHQRLQFDYQSKAHPSVIRNLYKISIPSINEQIKIGQAAIAGDNEIAHWAKYLEKLRTEKKALMQQLLTGKRRVQI
ncbi:restriction endonuclease subunit S [Sulfitobacter faviae]|uniref:restriction endonuclease subunit S n=1 Tax=Sulfitobacter faviae TaxID=1775881 RepID=UPI00398D29F0